MTNQTAVDYRTAPPKITTVATAWQAWWEDHDMWDGFIQYADLDTAKHHAAVDYIGEEYSWVPGDDPDDEAPEATLTWAFEHQRWHLLDNGANTGVQLYKSPTYAVSAGLVPATDVPSPSRRAGLRDNIAAALREHYLSTNREEADADGNMPCRCGDWREPGPMGSDEEDWDAHLADAALAVLYREWPWLRAEAADQAAAELAVEEVRDLADELGTDLYRAQDALAFVGECCDIADREGRQPTTADVREWLKGARCGRQLTADARERADLRQRISTAVDEGFRLTAELEDLQLGDSITASVMTALAAVLPAPASRAAAPVTDVIRTFPFDNFGMDDVSFALEDDPEAQEWVPALADALLATLPTDTAQAVELRDYWHQEAMSATTRIIELEGQLEELRRAAVGVGAAAEPADETTRCDHCKQPGHSFEDCPNADQQPQQEG